MTNWWCRHLSQWAYCIYLWFNDYIAIIDHPVWWQMLLLQSKMYACKGAAWNKSNHVDPRRQQVNTPKRVNWQQDPLFMQLTCFSVLINLGWYQSRSVGLISCQNGLVLFHEHWEAHWRLPGTRLHPLRCLSTQSLHLVSSVSTMACYCTTTECGEFYLYTSKRCINSIV